MARTPAMQEAIEIADAQVNNFGLPTYTELEQRLRWALRFIEIYAHEHIGPATPEVNKVRATLAKIEPAA